MPYYKSEKLHFLDLLDISSKRGSRQLCCREPTPRPSPSQEGKELIYLV
ncbi:MULTISPECIES: hypothetical protein [unclassified Okeania]|nr:MULTISPECIES: hypothetical protein [unclassified Okeania]NET97587.1 hypothetical protein [Okeania sp. SIO1H2]